MSAVKRYQLYYICHVMSSRDSGNTPVLLMWTIIIVLCSCLLSKIIFWCRHPLVLSLEFCLAAGEFLQVLNSRSSERCCTADTKSCQDVVVHSHLLGSSQSLSLPALNLSLAFCSLVQPNGFVYKNQLGDEAVITVSPRSGAVFGSFKTHQGKSFGIEKCQTKQVLKEFDLERFDEEEVVNSENWSNNIIPDSAPSDRRRLGILDNSTLVEYTVMFYYTPDFAKITADIAGYVDQVLAETNQGYVNSDVPLRVSKYCIEPAGISDDSDTISMLNTFTVMKEQLG